MDMAFLLLRHRMLEPVHRYAGRKITTTGTLECSELVAVEASISSDLANRMHTAFLCFSMRMTFGRSHPYDELQVQSKSAHHAGFIVPDAQLSSERTYSVCIDGWKMAKKTLLYAGSVKR
jgi:hypothetical protein